MGLNCRLAFGATAARNAGKTNLLLIMTDQQRFDAMSCAGAAPLQTPNMDRLARDGARFTRAYTHCPVCGPARTSLLTGRALCTTATPTNRQASDDAHGPDSPLRKLRTFDEILSAQGYWAEFHGKWHTPEMRGGCYRNPVTVAGRAKTVFGPGMHAYFLDYLERNGVPLRKPRPGEQQDTYTKRPYVPDPIDKRYGRPPTSQWTHPKEGEKEVIQPDIHGCLDIPAEHSITALQAKDTIAALKRAKGKPFTITCSFHYPHAPMTPTKPYHGMYPLEAMQPAASIGDSLENSPYRNAAKHHRAPEYGDPKKIRHMMSNYFGLVHEIDVWIGRILDALRETGAEENTLVIFTSDHGEMLGAHGMREKNVFYEESAHIPLIMRLPGRIPAGRKVERPVGQLDLFATILDYLKAPPHPSDGESLRPLIDGADRAEGCVISEWAEGAVPGYMVFDGRWKLMFGRDAKSPALDGLYDLKNDPHEMQNLLGANPERARYRGEAERLKAQLLEWMKKVGDPNYASVKARPAVDGHLVRRKKE